MLIECVICYEHLQSSDAIYHTPCGHVFHFSCITQWFKRSRTCPECREKIREKKIKRLYLNFVSNDSVIDDTIVSSLQTQISGLNHELLIKELEIIESNSNNTKLSALLKVKDSEIARLQTSIWIAQEDSKLWKNHIEGQKKEVEAMKKDIARIASERDQVMSSHCSWEKVSQMFHGITNHDTLVNMISDMKRELGTCTSNRWELQDTAAKLQQELTEVSEARKSIEYESSRKREMESNLACLEIEKLSLLRRIKELENIVESGVLPDESMRRKTCQESTDSVCNTVPFKKRKVDTSDIITEIDDDSTARFDVIDLTVEPIRPLIDLTKDTI